jgi:hypothetical protein
LLHHAVRTPKLGSPASQQTFGSTNGIDFSLRFELVQFGFGRLIVSRDDQSVLRHYGGSAAFARTGQVLSYWDIDYSVAITATVCG